MRRTAYRTLLYGLRIVAGIIMPCSLMRQSDNPRLRGWPYIFDIFLVSLPSNWAFPPVTHFARVLNHRADIDRRIT